jgi:hypothetical protein
MIITSAIRCLRFYNDKVAPRLLPYHVRGYREALGRLMYSGRGVPVRVENVVAANDSLEHSGFVNRILDP